MPDKGTLHGYVLKRSRSYTWLGRLNAVLGRAGKILKYLIPSSNTNLDEIDLYIYIHVCNHKIASIGAKRMISTLECVFTSTLWNFNRFSVEWKSELHHADDNNFLHISRPVKPSLT